jgi:peptide/nickel transport system permease protein
MISYCLNRTGQALLVLCWVVALTFTAIQLIPGDALLAALGSSGNVVDVHDLDVLRKAFGGQGTPIEQFWIWSTHFMRGDWGISMGTGQRVLQMFAERAPVTAELFCGGLLWALVLGVPAGIICAVRPGARLDRWIGGTSMTLIALPPAFEALALIYIFGVYFRLLPVSGYTPFTLDPWGNLQGMMLPSFVIGSHLAGVLARYVRASLIEVLRQDFIRTARAKGLSEIEILFRHAVKPSMIPIVTVLGFSFAGMLAGSFLVEVIFALPGIGRMAVDAAFVRDVPVILAVVIVASLNVLLVNFLVDIVYAVLDPRIRLR